MRVLIIADDDSIFNKNKPETAELLIACGDLTNETLLKVARASGCKSAFAVRGNHDSLAPFPAGYVDLHLRVAEYGRLRFAGFHGSWRYKPKGYHLWEQDEVSALMRQLPAVDIFVAHNSPRGIHERDTDVHQGFDGFREYIVAKRPRFFIHGHQHANDISKLEDTTIVGVYGTRVLDINENG